MKPQFFARDCLVVCCLTSERSHMLQFWDGSGAVYLFIYLRSAIQCIRSRGARSSQGHYIKSAPVDLIQSETQFLC